MSVCCIPMLQRDALQCSGPAGSRQQQLTRRANVQRHQDSKSGANPGGSPKTADTSVVPQTTQSTPPPSTTPAGGGGAQTLHCLPSQLENPHVTMLMQPLAVAQKNTNTLCGFILLQLTREIYPKVFSILVI